MDYMGGAAARTGFLLVHGEVMSDGAAGRGWSIKRAREAWASRVCVTVSVTVRSERDGQDATGHDRSIEPYLA